MYLCAKIQKQSKMKSILKDLISNFLPNTSTKMIFVYGEFDYWTGGAIPDPTNPNVRKIIVPRGGHNDDINNAKHFPAESREEIVSAIKAFLAPGTMVK